MTAGDLDLTAAVDAAAQAHLAASAAFSGVGRRWADLNPWQQHELREYVLPLVTRAAPLIAAQVAERIAAAIEAEGFRDRTESKPEPCPDAADGLCHADARMTAYMLAARIAREAVR